ncbi:MarR family winged helix-turn-helix transcriptional regulator [Oceanirhabdus sp. W0125-5]|uniref:MarR family winged helix-turn-helix transcriptional regulator n=1 Tax=Oceanirhabdus sp. W0125-5 TaxID=2999116 RepID=UPI0022F327D1|nr:MarR family transcriptional regulator [Oceanirhabdus sp. W0125-5]WBW96160.1 MarR family transcriptional regulator [Oceanirhabdus sp. W0125-5]
MNCNNDECIEHIELLLRKICFEIKKKGREILNNYDITPPQFDALQKVIWCKSLTIGELSSKLYLAPSTITDLVDRMEKTGLVERVKDQKDRRVVKVQPLEKGNSLIEEVLKQRREYIASLLSDLEESEKKDFVKYLEVLSASSHFD